MKKRLLLAAFVFAFGGASAQYCTPAYQFGDCTSGDFINHVSFANLSNSGTGCLGGGSNYADYTSMTASVVKGGTYSVAVGSGPDYGQYVAAMFDWNQDNDFEDANEYYELGLAAAGTNVLANVTVPATALNGNTRMRVMSQYDGGDPSAAMTLAVSCIDTLTYGEYEDYTVNVSDPSALDAGVVLVAATDTNCLLSATQTVQATITNFGTDPITTIDVTISMNGGATTTETYNGTIAPGASVTHEFAVTFDMSAAMAYVFDAATILSGDGNSGNDGNSTTITLPGPPTLNLDAVYFACGGALGDSIWVQSFDQYDSYLWSDGSTEGWLYETEGTFWLQVSDAFGCTASDTFDIAIDTTTSYTLDLGGDTALLCGESMLLQATAGPVSFTWNDFSYNSYLEVTAAGQYYVDVYHNCTNNQYSDTIVVVTATPAIINLGDDYEGCDEQILNGGGSFASHLWSTGETTTLLTVNHTMSDSIYSVTVTAANGCTATDEVVVLVEDCSSIEEIDAQMIRWFPNPATTFVTVEFNGMQSLQAELYDVAGRLVKSQWMSSGDQLKVTDLEKGVYYIRVGSKTQQLLINK